MRGESWLGVEQTQSLPSRTQTHAQPLPKRVAPALAKSAFRLSRPPSSALIASASFPVGSPPPLGPMIFQKKL